MAAIADALAAQRPREAEGVGPIVNAPWSQALRARVDELAAHGVARTLHPARTVVLLPFGQLLGVARSAWADGAARATGFAPRFETTLSWARSAGGFVPGAQDMAFDRAEDLLTAQSLLARAGLAREPQLLAGALVDRALALAPLAAAQPPAARTAWARCLREQLAGMTAPAWSRTEQALDALALAWVGSSAFASDPLLEGAARAQADALVLFEGLQPDPVADALAACFDAAAVLRLPLALREPEAAPQALAALHPADDAEDEAERAAACVLAHVAAGHVPVALVATDRALTRRIGAQLALQGLRVQDETGWKLSTTRAAAHLMALLGACAPAATSDEVLDALKNAPALRGPRLDLLEERLRRTGLREWASWCALAAAPQGRGADEALRAFTAEVEALRRPLARARRLQAWRGATRELLQAAGLWEALQADAAGLAVLQALGLDGDPDAWRDAGPAQGVRFTLAEFGAWAREVLEAGSVVLGAPASTQPPVTVLPLAQLLGRAFAAVVLPGCDEQRLPASPAPPGEWSEAQRVLLGLPGREQLAAAQRAAWREALRAPRLDLLWRRFDGAGEPVAASALLQALQQAGLAQAAADPRGTRSVPAAPTAVPRPHGDALVPARLSASAYADLRHCPYRFFALRQLGLASADELDTALDKRDFGTWLHAVLRHFHEALNRAPTPDRRARGALISIAAEQATRELALAEAEFLPFAAAWPAVREGYLDWLADHERDLGAAFEAAELWREQPLGSVTLVGQIDRIDRLADGRAFVIDYKTEAAEKTRQRLKAPYEDTQLAFYAALLDEDTLRAAYVNVGEREPGTETRELTEVVAVRDQLLEGIRHDLQRIAQGAPLPPLGEGAVCEHCAARGLCRKDWWGP